jgi:spermidine synthase
MGNNTEKTAADGRLLRFGRQIRSWWQPTVIETSRSMLNPNLEVAYSRGRLELNALSVNYSFGELHQIFSSVFAHYPIAERPIRQVLILGLGAGSLLHILWKHYRLDCEVTGVEACPEVLRLAREHFGLGDWPKLFVVETWAEDFVREDTEQYDLVIVDVFVDDQVPSSLSQPAFLGHLRERVAPGGLLLFNRIADTPETAAADKAFDQVFQLFFPSRECYHTLGNSVYYADLAAEGQTPFSPEAQS